MDGDNAHKKPAPGLHRIELPGAISQRDTSYATRDHRLTCKWPDRGHQPQQQANHQKLKELRRGLEQSRQAVEDTRDQVLRQIHENSALSSQIGGLRSEGKTIGRRLEELRASRRQQSDEREELLEKLAERIVEVL